MARAWAAFLPRQEMLQRDLSAAACGPWEVPSTAATCLLPPGYQCLCPSGMPSRTCPCARTCVQRDQRCSPATLTWPLGARSAGPGAVCVRWAVPSMCRWVLGRWGCPPAGVGGCSVGVCTCVGSTGRARSRHSELFSEVVALADCPLQGGQGLCLQVAQLSVTAFLVRDLVGQRDTPWPV